MVRYNSNLELNPHAASRRSNCRIALQQGLQTNKGIVQRDRGHFAISHRTCMFCQSATRSIAVLRPLQSTASVIGASVSAASLGFVGRLQRCAECGPQQGRRQPAGVAAASGAGAIELTPVDATPARPRRTVKAACGASYCSPR